MNYPVSEHKIISTAELRELEAENERLLNEVQHLENINSNFMDINAAYQLRVATLEQQVEELTAKLATCRQAAFENGRAGDFLTEQAIEEALGVED